MSNIQGIQKISSFTWGWFSNPWCYGRMALFMTGEAGSPAAKMKCFNLPNGLLSFLLSSSVFTFLCLPSTFYTKSLFSCLEFGMFELYRQNISLFDKEISIFIQGHVRVTAYLQCYYHFFLIYLPPLELLFLNRTLKKKNKLKLRVPGELWVRAFYCKTLQKAAWMSQPLFRWDVWDCLNIEALQRACSLSTWWLRGTNSSFLKNATYFLVFISVWFSGSWPPAW